MESLLKNRKIKKIIVPVAGLGTRMLPATKAIPKEMLPIVNKPIIQYIIEEIVYAGFEEVILVTHSSKYSIENHFDQSFELENTLKKRLKRAMLKEIKGVSKLKVSLQSIRQGEAKGLGHAILCAQKIIGKEPFAIALPDMLISKENGLNGKSLKEMKENYERNELSSVLLGKVKKEKISNYGIVKLKKDKKYSSLGFIEKIVEKPTQKKAPSNLYAVGRYIFNNDLFNYLEKVKPDKSGEIQLTDAIDLYINKGNDVLGYLLDGDVYDCGEKTEFILANIDFAIKDSSISKIIKKHLKMKLF